MVLSGGSREQEASLDGGGKSLGRDVPWEDVSRPNVWLSASWLLRGNSFPLPHMLFLAHHRPNGVS